MFKGLGPNDCIDLISGIDRLNRKKIGEEPAFFMQILLIVIVKYYWPSMQTKKH